MLHTTLVKMLYALWSTMCPPLVHRVQGLTQMAVHAADALMAAVTACTDAPACTQPDTATLRHIVAQAPLHTLPGRAPQVLPQAKPHRCCKAKYLAPQTGAGTHPQCSTTAAAAAGGRCVFHSQGIRKFCCCSLDSVCNPSSGRMSLTREQQQWMYEMATAVLVGVCSRPSTTSMCANLGGSSMQLL